MTVKEVIDIAKGELGTVENPPNSNCVKYNDWFYNRQSVSGAAYPWCCVFISWLFRKEPKLIKKTASCMDLYNWFKMNGQIVKKPQAGDIVFFKYNTNSRFTNHVGLVISVSADGKVINTIEGNTSTSSQDNGGKVMQRNRYNNIVGYGRPKYSDSGNTAQEPTPVNHSAELEKVARDVIAGKYGNGNDVRKANLARAGYNDYEAIRKIVNRLKKEGK